MWLLKGRRASLAAGAAAAALLAAAGPAFAQAPATLDLARQGEVTRLRIILPESEGGDLTAQAEIAAGAVLVARLSESITADLTGLTQGAPDRVAMARLDPDGRTLRLALNTTLEPRVSISHNIIAIDLAPAGTAPLADVVSPYERARRAEAQAREAARLAAEAEANRPEPALPARVSVGEAAEYTRIVFQWPEAVTYALERDGDRAVLRFSRLAQIDLAELRADPPRFVDAVTELEGEGLSLAFAVAGGTETRVWSDEPGRVVLDVAPSGGGIDATLAALAEFANQGAQTSGPAQLADEEADVSDSAPEASDPRPDPGSNVGPAAQASPEPNRQTSPVALSDPAQEAEPAQARPDPVPASGVVPVQVRPSGEDLVLSFSWASLPGAAVFRRGDALWVVFDAAAELDASEIAAAGSRHVEGYQSLTGDDYTALRLESRRATQADVRAAGSSWTVTLGDSVDEPPLPVRMARETGYDRPALLRFGLNGARSVRRVPDPVIGDELYVLTADGEKRGVITPRQFVEVSILASAHGVAVQTFADDLTFEVEPGGATLSRPSGLALSRAASPTLGGGADQPVTAGFLDLTRWRGEAPFTQTRARLERAALELEPEALLALARFHLAWSLAPEALALTHLAVQERPALDTTPEIAALRGAASYMIGRMEQADAFFSHPDLMNDPAAQPWRGLIAAEASRWPEARRRFEEGRESTFFLDPMWRGRVRAWHALSAVETNDIGAVRELTDLAAMDTDDAQARAVAAFARAGLAAAEGDTGRAIAGYDALSTDAWTPIQARALLAKLNLEVDEDLIDPDEAVEALESLRYRWRGDNVEVEAAAMLGRVYADAGRFDQALATMEGARARYPGSPVARRLGMEMQTLFRDLFLNGRAERMDPLDALALWYEHQDLTPLGPDGLRMARRIAGRLIDIDLLEPAGELLAHQVFERTVTMTNLARAEIAADLARVRLMDNRPEDALRALESTRVARLPQELVRERRLLQARALSDLGRSDHALELISNDSGAEVDRLRAEIAWEARNWADAGRRAEALLGDRWRGSGALDGREAHDVLRTVIAYALAGETAGIERVESRYGAAMAATRHAAAFSQLVNTDSAPGDVRLSALVAELGAFEDADALMAGFMEPTPDGEAGES